MQVQKTVFISYRRTNAFTARAVYQDLTYNGYDTFLDYQNIDTGAFGQVILNQIAARAHFLVVLTPSALERCNEPGDWLRREIEHALDLKRNIVPLIFEGFDFNAMTPYLTGKLALLPQYSGLAIPADYFEEAMTRLRTRFLSQPLETILHATPPADELAVRQQQAAAQQAPPVTEEQLSAEEYFERAFNRPETDYEGKIADYSEAIRLNPQYANAYNNRGVARYDKGDLTGAIADFNKALRLDPQDDAAYNNRGNARRAKGDLDGAITDYNEAIRLNPQYGDLYLNRGNARSAKGDLDGAIADFNKALRLDPQDAEAYNNRAMARYAKGDIDGAIADFTEAIRLNPQDEYAYNNRGIARYEGDVDGAIADYTEAIRLNPQYATAYNNRGEVYFELQDYAKARSDFQKANELDPAYPYALAGLAITHHAMGELQKARAFWKLLVGLDSRYQDADWTGQEFNWHPPLIEEARKLTAAL